MRSQRCRRLAASSVCVGLLATVFGGSSAAAAVKFMPLGDSITQGGRIDSRLAANEGTVGYRYPLFFLLNNAGYAVDFVGTQNTIFSPTVSPPATTTPSATNYPLYNSTFDRNNQGHWGTQAETVDSATGTSITNSLNTLQGQGNLPDVVLIHLGTNDLRDVASNADVDVVVGHISGIITRLRAKKSNVKVFVSSIDNNITSRAAGQPSSAPNYQAWEAVYNTKLNTMVGTVTTPTSPVYFIDLANGFNPDTMTYDGTHMNKLGEDYAAGRYFTAMTAVGAVPEPITVTALLAGGAGVSVRRRR